MGKFGNTVVVCTHSYSLTASMFFVEKARSSAKTDGMAQFLLPASTPVSETQILNK